MQWNAVMLWICIGLDSRKWAKYFVVLYFANIRDKSDSISEYPLRRSLEKDLFVFFVALFIKSLYRSLWLHGIEAWYRCWRPERKRKKSKRKNPTDSMLNKRIKRNPPPNWQWHAIFRFGQSGKSIIRNQEFMRLFCDIAGAQYVWNGIKAIAQH